MLFKLQGVCPQTFFCVRRDRLRQFDFWSVLTVLDRTLCNHPERDRGYTRHTSPGAVGSLGLPGVPSETTVNVVSRAPEPEQQDEAPLCRQTPASTTVRGWRADWNLRWSEEVGSPVILRPPSRPSAHTTEVPLWASEIPWLLLLPHPVKIITSSGPRIKTATAWNNFSVLLSGLICLSFLPEYPISQDSRQCLKSTKLLSFHLRLFCLGPRLPSSKRAVSLIFILSRINHAHLPFGVSWSSYGDQAEGLLQTEERKYIIKNFLLPWLA